MCCCALGGGGIVVWEAKNEVAFVDVPKDAGIDILDEHLLPFITIAADNDTMIMMKTMKLNF